MSRILLAAGLVATSMLAWAVGRAETPPGLKETLALQETVQNAIQEAEPAIACILISRNPEYRRRPGVRSDDLGLPLDRPTPEEEAGQLGDFDSSRGDRNKDLDLGNPRNVPESYGSGVVLDEAGLVLTNEHVIRGAVKVFVRLPGGAGRYANIVAADPRSDLAVLGLINPPKGLRTLKFGDGGALRKGQWVVSLANPFAAGFRDGSPSASWGIVSNLRRRAPGSPSEIERSKVLHHYGTLIQTDARLNLGCSGGALIDLQGNLIGLTTSLAALSNTETAGGFAVPVDARFKRVLEILKRGEEVEYGFMGVSMRDDGTGGERVGVRLESVLANSPAALAGLKRDDWITRVNGQAVRDTDDLLLAVSMVLAGREPVSIERTDEQGRSLPPVKVVMAKAPVPGKVIASHKPDAVRGLRVDYTSTLAPTLSDRIGAPRGLPTGVVVRELVSGSLASKASLRVGDVITHLNGREVHNPAEFYAEAAKDAGKPLELSLEGGDKPVRIN